MKNDFFESRSLDDFIQMIRDLAQLNLFPSKEAFAQLQAFEEQGFRVEAMLEDILEGVVLRQYRLYKEPVSGEFPDESDVQKWPNATKAYEGFALALRTKRDISSKFPIIYEFHKQDVPVFTIMHLFNKGWVADAYRTWLFEHYG